MSRTWLILPAVVLLLIVAGLLDSKYRVTQRWAERAEERDAAKPGAGRHRPGQKRPTAAAVLQRVANERRRAEERARAALARLETTHEFTVPVFMDPARLTR